MRVAQIILINSAMLIPSATVIPELSVFIFSFTLNIAGIVHNEIYIIFGPTRDFRVHHLWITGHQNIQTLAQ